ncbi:SpoIID/LytB domain-containing protein [Fusibacillus kribbianus]|uniref:SpoIID/LytB domain-containing protein n=1 Tax=Fusibacillus kribbianus TaxID=3044208 RepID=A0AAP4EZ31_9FIRM|nr:SpoIID/LytB domain-containing protein [Ruminococcus sp. YH-rum2234]MDI9241375.1 SpoIID/LytB domain-containing protein [Ruminococcus sp. YH-rum2234]
MGRKRSSNRRKMLPGIFLALALLAIVGLCIRSFSTEKEDTDGISRALAARQTALLLASAEEIKGAGEANASGAWYMPYGACLYEKGVWDKEVIPDDRETYEGLLTWNELASMAEKLSLTEELNPGKGNVTEEEWEAFYELLLKKYNREGAVVRKELTIIGTPNQLSEAGAWEVYTDQGVFSFEGLSMDRYVDRLVKGLVRGNQLLMVTELLSDEITYENVWIESYENQALRVNVCGIWRELSLGREGEKCGQAVADITMKEGKVSAIFLKRDSIRGKLLALGETELEIEGYGRIPTDEKFRVFQIRDGFEEFTREKLTVGYDQADYIVAGGKICAVILGEPVLAGSIRVLLTDYRIGSIYHETVSFTSDHGFTVYYGKEESERHGAGELVEMAAADARLSEGRIRIVPDEGGKIGFTSFSRKYGEPWYEGTAEVVCSDNGLLIINEVDLETYLCYVVPSEMPESYGLEALKAQAVCARSYACRQIEKGTYSLWGAHVDDTTAFQVYNNTETDPLTRQAVEETRGQVITCGGELVTAYYYATSCGYGNDLAVWGESENGSPYLKSISMSDGEAPDLSEESAFRTYLETRDPTNLEYSAPWYRWETEVSLETLKQRMDSFLKGYAKNHRELVLFREEDGSFCEADEDGPETIGEIVSMTVLERERSGYVSIFLVEGTKGAVQILRPGPLRAFLGGTEQVYQKSDGSQAEGKTILPSASIWLEEKQEEDSLKGYVIHGGGYGHGVGMSQTAASALSARGKTCQEILQYFYPGTEIGEILLTPVRNVPIM